MVEYHAALDGLNPFFVRSSFQSEVTVHSLVQEVVLIPSSSGLHFRARKLKRRLPISVLIPSSSGLHFRVRWGRSVCCLSSVLIPSSSGLHFREDHVTPPVSPAVRLNPFFVRSSFQSSLRFRVSTFGRVLIPSSSGLHFRAHRNAKSSSAESLNPFFVRSSFQRVEMGDIELGRGVLIPSSSGLHFRVA